MKQLLFVYNTNSSVFSLVSDYVHKAFSPKTYDCNLCKITYSNLGMKREWKKFIQTLNPKPEFLYKNKLHKQYPSTRNIPLPAVFQKNGKELHRIVSAKQINSVKTIEQLIDIINHVNDAD